MSSLTQGLIEPYLAKLERRRSFSQNARAALAGLPTQLRVFGRAEDIVREGDEPHSSCLVQSGILSRYKSLPDGGRQIVSFSIAGDMVDLQSVLVLVADHGIRTQTAARVVMIRHADLLRVSTDHPEVARALWFDTLVDGAIFREWTVNVGRRNARAATAHLLLEMEWRLARSGLAAGDSFELPVSQTDLADALVISPVHLNRTFQWLRAQELIRTCSQTVTVLDRDALVELAGFTSDYLHPEGPRTLDLSRRQPA